MKRLALALLLMLPAMGADKTTASGTVGIQVIPLDMRFVLAQYASELFPVGGTAVFVRTTALDTRAFNIVVRYKSGEMELTQTQTVDWRPGRASYSTGFFFIDPLTVTGVTVEELKPYVTVEFSGADLKYPSYSARQ